MSKPIRRVAVLGAGVMGAGIAAHVASAGIPVLLLDIVPPNLKPEEAKSRAARNKFAAGALANMAKAKPAPFMSAGAMRLVSIGNLEDDLADAAKCDLIIEAIIEKLDIKRALYARLDELAGPDTIIASNTSGLRIVDLLEGRSAKFKQSFLVLHFFNPPRYMKLLEVVAGADTSAEAIERSEQFGRELLGKGLVRSKDVPNFIANRVGTYSMMAAIHLMLEHDLAPEDVDAITGEPMAHPRSAIFRTGDLVGLDTLVHVVENCHAVLKDDKQRAVFEVPGYIKKMIEAKQLGDKTRGGFYRKTKDGIETLDPKTGAYRAKGGSADIAKASKGLGKVEDVRKRVAALVATPGVVGEYAWKVLSRTLAYSAVRVGEISDDVAAIDEGMRWGYNWELGPFEVWDALGVAATVERMKKDGLELPASIDKMVAAGATSFYKGGEVWDLAKAKYVPRARDPREATLDEVRRHRGVPSGASGSSFAAATTTPVGALSSPEAVRGHVTTSATRSSGAASAVLTNGGAEAWDLGDGVLGVTFKSKANSLDSDVIAMLHQATERAERDFASMLVFNQGEHFCVGANLFAVVMAAQQQKWDQLGEMVSSYQQATQRMKYAQVPVVAAPYGMTLGGGLELCFACDAVQAAAETYSGLVEVGVGLIPGGAGTLNMLWRALESVPAGVDPDVYPFVTQVFKNIALAKVATSAQEAKELGFFRAGDGVTFDRARHLHEARQRAIGLAAGYHPPLPRAHRLPGESGIATLGLLVNTLVAGGYASEHDALIARKLAVVLCGGPGGHTHEVSEQEVLDLEREAFLSLCGEQKSQERMQHMLMNNKPLRN